MSRRPRPLVWFQWFGVKDEALCPVCNVQMMQRDDGNSWHREHILRLSLGGLDVYPNLIPICRSCNLGMGKRCRSTYHYLVTLGKMSAQQALLLEGQHQQQCLQFDPRCEAEQKNGNRCANLKGGKNESFCMKHINQELVAMDCT